MTYASLEHFRDVTSRNVLALQEAREKGRKVVGQFCIYSPLEIALAAGAVPVSLCGTKQDSIPVAEEVLPRCLCPLIKSSFGFALQDSCPYLAASDIVVADATCDGKKKMYELLAAYKPVMVLQLPQIQDERAHAYWREQYALLVARLEQDFGVRITEEKLRAAMDLTSRLRQALKKVLDLARRRPSPLRGLDLLDICFRASFMPDYEQAIRLLEAIHAELQDVPAAVAPDAPRILLTGVPTGMGSHKVVQLLEECGASVVCIDNCTCYKKVLLNMEDKIQKTQISFYQRHLFAAVSLPVRRRKDWPAHCIVLTLGLPALLDSPRIAMAVEPYPGRWTHHILIDAPDQIDAQLLSWLQEARAFALAKGSKRA